MANELRTLPERLVKLGLPKQTLVNVFKPFGGKLVVAFPKLEPVVPPDESEAQLRERLRASLAKSRRKKRAG
ncbi:MAG: hypothetical protein JNK82_07600 [Myxococcaceae bacterium]|nr:hypothetical protein [Myxococcaceae bacterium]